MIVALGAVEFNATGRPAAVIPAGRLMPGMPATLPGSVLRMKVANVGAALPLNMKVLADLSGRRRRSGEDDRRNSVVVEWRA
jgi:hypothetical protein